MQKARKILVLATSMTAVSCSAGLGLPLGDSIRESTPTNFTPLRPLTAPDGRPACGNVLSKGPPPQPPPQPPAQPPGTVA
jgi:hypothetical protein